MTASLLHGYLFAEPHLQPKQRKHQWFNARPSLSQALTFVSQANKSLFHTIELVQSAVRIWPAGGPMRHVRDRQDENFHVTGNLELCFWIYRTWLCIVLWFWHCFWLVEWRVSPRRRVMLKQCCSPAWSVTEEKCGAGWQKVMDESWFRLKFVYDLFQ